MNDEKDIPVFQLRLMQLLGTESKAVGGYLKLEKNIEQANNYAEGYSVDRRKLAAIADGDDIKVSFKELQALSAFFAYRELPSPFEKLSLLEPVVRNRNIVFMLGAKPRSETTDISRWDVVAMALLQRAVFRLANAVKLEIEDVRLHGDSDPEFRRSGDDPDYHRLVISLLQREPWMASLRSRSGTSFIAIGSPRASHATEYMLSEMFRVTPFNPVSHSSENGPPFRFIWQKSFGLPSSFGVETKPDSVLHRDFRTFGVEIRGEKHDCVRDGEVWQEYGLIAAQRRMSGQVWLVLAGLTGGATEATARFVEAFNFDLPAATETSHGDVVWAVVEASIKVSHDHQDTGGGDRQVVGQRLFRGPYLFK